VIFGSIHSFVCLGLLIFSTVLWLIDYIWFRARRIRKEVTVTNFSLLPGNLVKLGLEIEDFEYKAGQFLFVAIPGIQSGSSMEFHPFSISSAPYQKNKITIHVRALGDWTRSLQEAAEDYLTAKTKKSKKGKHKSVKELLPRVKIDGPFGTLSLPQRLYDYECILFISGGIGVTPLQSLFNSYLHYICSRKKYEKMKRVHFVWACRENSDICKDYAGTATIDQIKYLHFQPNLLEKKFLEHVEKNNVYNKSNCDIDFYLTHTSKLQSKKYLKRATTKVNEQLPQRPSNIKIRLPDDQGLDVFLIVRKMFKQACVSDVTRIAVLVSGPTTLIDETQRACLSCKSLCVAIDFHQEKFAI
jgi:predicted ferric reductase